MRRRAAAGGALGALVAEGSQVNRVEQRFAAAEEDGRDDEVEVVDESRLKVLRMVDTPPPRRMSFACAASRACCSVDSIRP
jgi:hypothetical protein